MAWTPLGYAEVMRKLCGNDGFGLGRISDFGRRCAGGPGGPGHEPQTGTAVKKKLVLTPALATNCKQQRLASSQGRFSVALLQLSIDCIW